MVRLFSSYHQRKIRRKGLSINYRLRDILCTVQVIAIVTDRLTDGAIIGDLHNAASRGVPVYIILNQRSIQENFTLKRLLHPVSHLPQTSTRLEAILSRLFDTATNKPEILFLPNSSHTRSTLYEMRFFLIKSQMKVLALW